MPPDIPVHGCATAQRRDAFLRPFVGRHSPWRSGIGVARVIGLPAYAGLPALRLHGLRRCPAFLPSLGTHRRSTSGGGAQLRSRRLARRRPSAGCSRHLLSCLSGVPVASVSCGDGRAVLRRQPTSTLRLCHAPNGLFRNRPFPSRLNELGVHLRRAEYLGHARAMLCRAPLSPVPRRRSRNQFQRARAAFQSGTNLPLGLFRQRAWRHCRPPRRDVVAGLPSPFVGGRDLRAVGLGLAIPVDTRPTTAEILQRRPDEPKIRNPELLRFSPVATRRDRFDLEDLDRASPGLVSMKPPAEWPLNACAAIRPMLRQSGR